MCKDEASCNAGVGELLASMKPGMTVVGLDVEWRPRRDKNEDVQPVAVAQLSSSSVVLVIQVLRIGHIPHALKELLLNKKIFKVGVGVAADALALQRSYEVEVRGCLELELLLTRTANCGGAQGFSGGASLKSLAQFFLGIELDKNPQLRCSDWSLKELSEGQITYAAADAYYSWAIFDRLLRIRAEAQSKPLDEATLNGFVAGLIDARREKHQQKLKQAQHASSHSSQRHHTVHKPKPSRFESITKNLYDNFRVEDPNGNFMFTCDRKKRNWYLDRNLAVVKEDSPQTLRLTFQPKGLGNQGSAFYEEGLDNRCVVCGVEHRLVRHHVIPHSYRRHFPMRIKSHSSHDVVLMCVACHSKSQAHCDQMKITISAEMKIPLDAPQDKVSVNLGQQKARNAALALVGSQADHIPAEQRKVLMETVGLHFGCCGAEVTNDMLQQAKQLKPRTVQSQEDAHEAQVVRVVFESHGIGGIHAFCRRWREHLLHTMQPRFLSLHWDVNFIKPNDEDLVPEEQAWDNEEHSQDNEEQDSEQDEVVDQSDDTNPAALEEAADDQQLVVNSN